ncbi:MAG: fasciclin domain-containing protein, partial [Caldilineae bacterium]
ETPTPEATPEATSEATPEATAEPTAEATPEATETPATEEGAAPETTPAPAEEAAADIIDTATASGDFEILLLALSLANLTDTLHGEGPFTVFAPGDPAFAALPEATLDTLLADTGELAKVLQLHVVPGKLTAADITDGMTVETLGGETLTFGIAADGSITVTGPGNSATITNPDMMASNGVIHVLNAVLLQASAGE